MKSFKICILRRILDTKTNFTNGRKNNSDKLINFMETPQDQNNWGWKLYYKYRKFLIKLNSIKFKNWYHNLSRTAVKGLCKVLCSNQLSYLALIQIYLFIIVLIFNQLF